MSHERTYWVIDCETMVNCFVLCGEEAHTNRKFHCVLWKNRNDLPRLFKFLHWSVDNAVIHVTFNGLAFDSQIFQWMLDQESHFLDPEEENDNLINEIYHYAQQCIEKSNTRQWLDYAPWKISIPQCDILALNNWSNSGKMCSLKWLQCNMDWPNIEDMPYSHTHYVENEEELGEVISYCYNDVAATKRGFQLCKEGVNMRLDLTEQYGLDLMSASEPKLSKELFLHFLSKKLMKDKPELKRWSTQRDIIKVKDILIPYIEFQRQEFTMLLNNFKKLEVNGNSLKGAFKYKVKYKGMTIDYGVGGIHGFSKPGIQESTETMVIKTCDVQSYYPNMAIRNKWGPAHIPKQAFCDQYEWFYEERKKHPKGSAINYVFKILLNATFGLSIDKFSFLSDSQFGVQITCNGQLLLSMLLEMLCEGIPDSAPLMLNTDGIEIMIPRQYESLYKDICMRWEGITKLVLEHDEYNKMWLYDCNNYLALFKSGKTKCKGRFEFEAHDKYDNNVLHKNKSFLVVAKGIYEYFVNGIAPEDYLAKNNNIYDYCGYIRAKGKWKLIEFLVSNTTGVTEKPIQKTLRYYISENGNKIIKRNSEDLRETQVVAGQWMLTVFNKYEGKEWSEYKINKKYYLKEMKKEIATLENKQKQLQLF